MKKHILLLLALLLALTACTRQEAPPEIPQDMEPVLFALDLQAQDLTLIHQSGEAIAFGVYTEEEADNRFVLRLKLAGYTPGGDMDGTISRTVLMGDDDFTVGVTTISDLPAYKELLRPEYEDIDKLDGENVVIHISRGGWEPHGAARTPTIYKEVNTLEHVLIEAEPGSLGRTGVKLIAYNEGEETIVFGTFYCLEELVDGQWYPLPYLLEEDTVGWNDVAYEVEAGSTLELEPINWDWLYGSLEDGEYRIIKDCFFDGSPQARNYLGFAFTLSGDEPDGPGELDDLDDVEPEPGANVPGGTPPGDSQPDPPGEAEVDYGAQREKLAEDVAAYLEEHYSGYPAQSVIVERSSTVEENLATINIQLEDDLVSETAFDMADALFEVFGLHQGGLYVNTITIGKYSVGVDD